ncbi:MAG: TonB-dependent receptor, partial [Leeuwenhoekiella sp.]
KLLFLTKTIYYTSYHLDLPARSSRWMKQSLFAALIFISGSQIILAQNNNPIIVTGTVTDPQGVPLPTVNVIEKNTNTGGQTDFDGNYSIEVSSADAILVFSFVGMKTTEVVVGANDVLDIQMQGDPQALDEVVLVGYGKQKKISVVGAQSTIEAEELELPVANIGTMLAGRIAGLTGVQRDGIPGFDGADLWIRGISSFGNSGPLILIDGVERSLDNIDPRDIASFSILKDASATAVYGIRGANGVILIETKKGKIGKPKVTLDYYEGITYFTKIPDLADGVTYMKLANEALTTRGQVAKYSQQYIDQTASGENPLLYPNVDWIDEVFDDYGRNRRASLNVSGGAEDARYYLSLGYYDETGLFITDGLESYTSDTRFKRYNFTSNLTVDITKTTNINLGIQGYLSQGTYPGRSPGDIFSAAMEAPPVEYPVIYPGGFVPGKSANGGLRNPYAEVAKRGYRDLTRNQVYTNLSVNQELSFITEGLSASGLFAFDNYNEQDVNRTKRQSTYFVDQNFPYTDDGALLLNETYSGQNFLGYDRSNRGNRRFYLQASLNYDRSFGKHSVSGLLLANRTDYTDAFAGNFTDAIPFRNQGLAGRATYSYDNRYFFEVNAGYNGSENFAPDNRYGFFPSVAVGWVASNEKFFEPLSNTINYLKFRYSDGLVGSESGAGRFSYLSRVEQQGDGAGYDFGENRQYTGGIVETYYGVNVTWAEARKQDLGIEFNALNNDLKVIFDLFKERTEGAFLNRGDIPNYIGLNSDPYGNLGIVENKGFDGTISYNTNINELKLDFRGTFSYNKNKIIENGQPLQPYPWLNRQGTGLLANFGLIAERLFTLEDDIDGDGFITPDDGFPTQYGQIQPGDIKYQDLNEDGQIDTYDRKEIGDGDVPALTYGFGLTAQYKGFDLSLFFQGQSFSDRFIGGFGVQPFVGGGGEGNIYSIATDRWTPENDNPYATYPRLSYGASGIGQNNNTQGSTWWLRDIDFFRLKTAEIGYTLPSSLTDKINLLNTRFYIRATNLFTISKFDLWDPELNTGNGSSYPNISVVSVGLAVDF